MKRPEKILCLTAGETALTVALHGQACLIENNSADTPAYFKERSGDGADVTSANGWVLAPGAVMPFPLTIRELSLAAGADNTDVRIMVLDET